MPAGEWKRMHVHPEQLVIVELDHEVGARARRREMTDPSDDRRAARGRSIKNGEVAVDERLNEFRIEPDVGPQGQEPQRPEGGGDCRGRRGKSHAGRDDADVTDARGARLGETRDRTDCGPADARRSGRKSEPSNRSRFEPFAGVDPSEIHEPRT